MGSHQEWRVARVSIQTFRCIRYSGPKSVLSAKCAGLADRGHCPPCKNESACRPSAAGAESSNGDWFSKARSCYDRGRVSVIILEPARLLPLHRLLLLLAQPVVDRAARLSGAALSRSA